jgi:hypothetical protein
MRFMEAIARAERQGWSLSHRSGQIVEPSGGVLVAVHSRQWWRVCERHLPASMVKLFVYSRAQDFAADPHLLLYIVRSEDHFSLRTARVVPSVTHAIPYTEPVDGVMLLRDAVTHALLTQERISQAA